MVLIKDAFRSFKTGKEIAMSCNSAVYTVNSSTPVLVAGAQVPFGSVVRRFGRAIRLDGNSVNICGPGYYDCELALTVSPTAGGAITAQLYQNGVAVPGAFSTAQGTAGNPVILPISAIVRNVGCDSNSMLSVEVDAACTVVNCAFVVEKI